MSGSFVESLQKTVVGSRVPPEDVVVVSVYLEEAFVGVDVGFCGEDTLEVADAAQLLLGLEDHQPVLGAQDLKTVGVVQLVEVVDIPRVVFLVLAAVVEHSLFLLLFQQLNVLLVVVLDADEIEDVGQEGVFDLAVHRRGGTQRRANVYLHQPRFQLLVYEDVETVELKAAGSFFLCFGMDVQHNWLCRNAGLYYHVLDLLEQLNRYRCTFCESMPMESQNLRSAVSDHFEPSPSFSVLLFFTNFLECLLTLKFVRWMNRLPTSLVFTLYQQVAKRVSPYWNMQILKGSQLVTRTQMRRSYLKLLMRWGLLMYQETRMSFLFFTVESFVTIFMPLPQAWLVGFIIHNLCFYEVQRAIQKRQKSAGKRQVLGTKLQASGKLLLCLLRFFHMQSFLPRLQHPGK